MRVGVLDAERPDGGPPQLLGVGVAEVGHEAADVGPRRALDKQARAVALPPELLEAVHDDLALGHDDLLPARARS